MSNPLEEIYKLAGFKTDVSKQLLKTANKLVQAAFLYEEDKVRQACKRAKLKEACSNKTSEVIESLYSEVYDNLFKNCLDKKFESAEILAEDEEGEEDWKKYRRILDENS